MNVKTALVTGATSGIGRELSFLLAEEGYNLLLLSKTQEHLDETARSIQTKYSVLCQKICINLANEKDLISFLKEGHHADLVVNCAGMGEIIEALTLEEEKEREMIQVNLDAPRMITKHYAKVFVQKKEGTVLNICSTASLYPQPYLTTYAASKSFLFSYSMGLAEEISSIAPDVHILTACPGPTRTSFFSEEQRRLMSRFPWDKWFEMEAEEVAKRIVKQMKSKKRVQIIGRRNIFLTKMIQWLPYAMQTKGVAYYMKKGVLK